MVVPVFVVIVVVIPPADTSLLGPLYFQSVTGWRVSSLQGPYLHSLSNHSLISSRSYNFTNHLEMDIETEGDAFLRPNGSLFQSCICSNALCWWMLAASVDLVPPSSPGTPGDLHFKVVLPALVLVASGFKRATHALGSLGISLLSSAPLEAERFILHLPS